jgi:hypothetical protein
MSGATPRFCSSCGGSVMVTDASFCKECGAALMTGFRLKHGLGWNPWIALALSIVPGLGQLYKGRRWRALGWFLLVTMAYGTQPLGYWLHIVCAVNAALAGAFEDRPRARLPHKQFEG